MISPCRSGDTYQQLKTAQKKKDEVVQYKLGDAVTHPKFRTWNCGEDQPEIWRGAFTYPV
mgnify:CR=1 FL=1